MLTTLRRPTDSPPIIHTGTFPGLNAEGSVYRTFSAVGHKPPVDRALELLLSLRDLAPAPAAALMARLPSGLLKFLAVGAAGLAVHTATFTLVLQLGADRSPAWLAGLVTSTLAAWSLNRRHTFAASGRSRREEIGRYGLVTLVAQGTSFAVFHLACRAAPHLWPQLCVLAGAASATVFSYTGQRFFTFAPQETAHA
jgi:putative flippase GtrA